MTDSPSDQPRWVEENRRLKREMGLPEYEPPRFSDGVYLHEVVPDLEDRHQCSIQFLGRNTRYPDDWTVCVDFEPVMPIGRHRDRNGNTVFERSSDEFCESIARHVSTPES